MTNASKATCIVPSMPTTESIKNFAISKPTYLALTWTGTGSAAELAKLSNKDNNDQYVDTDAACKVVTTFKTDMKAVLDEVSFFANRFKTTTDKEKLAGKLKFQGSDDGTAWTDIFEVGDEVHEGWNTKTWSGEVGVVAQAQPAYNSYRFLGSAAGACRMGEIKIRGVEGKASASGAASDECTPKMKIDGDELDLAKVTYEVAKTAKLTSISPRFGPVTGATEVTLTGTGFTATAADHTVLLDNIPCVVSASTATTVTCTTGKRPDIVVNGVVVGMDPVIDFTVKDMGKVATAEIVFRYVKLYSDPNTW